MGLEGFGNSPLIGNGVQQNVAASHVAEWLNMALVFDTIRWARAGRVAAAPAMREERKVRTPEGRVVANGNSPKFWDMESATERKPP
jgi:hypothetical protein